MSATMPPSWVFCPPLLPDALEAVTRFSPSIITIFDFNGVNGALSAGSVNDVVVAFAAGRQVDRPGEAPSGW